MTESENQLDEAIALATKGQFPEAVEIFHSLLADDPSDPVVLYNLGMCFTELGEPGKAITALKQCLKYAPGHSNALTALAVAQGALGQFDEAIRSLHEALKVDPDNSYALRNLGGLYGRRGDVDQALSFLSKAYAANPSDPATVYGLGQTHQQKKEYKDADRYYGEVLSMDAPEPIREAAMTGRREIAEATLKSKGVRMDAVMYMVGAMQLFRVESDARVKEIAFEIALKGRQGLDINNPDREYTLQSLPGEFTGLQLISYMYAGFKQIAPEQDVGIDLAQEYEVALQIAALEERH